jgi:hypothetical protein
MGTCWWVPVDGYLLMGTCWWVPVGMFKYIQLFQWPSPVVTFSWCNWEIFKYFLNGTKLRVSVGQVWVTPPFRDVFSHPLTFSNVLWGGRAKSRNNSLRKSSTVSVGCLVRVNWPNVDICQSPLVSAFGCHGNGCFSVTKEDQLNVISGHWFEQHVVRQAPNVCWTGEETCYMLDYKHWLHASAPLTAFTWHVGHC